MVKAWRQINPALGIKGIVMTMADRRTNHACELAQDVRNIFTGRVRVFKTTIPRGVAAADASKSGMSIFEYAPRCKVALAYAQLVQEIGVLGRYQIER